MGLEPIPYAHKCAYASCYTNTSKMVCRAGFEPATICFQSSHATRLRYRQRNWLREVGSNHRPTA